MRGVGIGIGVAVKWLKSAGGGIIITICGWMRVCYWLVGSEWLRHSAKKPTTPRELLEQNNEDDARVIRSQFLLCLAVRCAQRGEIYFRRIRRNK